MSASVTANPTDYRYTGQLEQASINLYWYRSRWFDPVLTHFVQADTYVPESQGVQAWDRYAYVMNSPVVFTDPSGHAVECGIYGGTSCAGVGPLEPTPVMDQNGITASVIYYVSQEEIVNGVNNAWEVTTTVYSVISEPVDWAVTGSQCLQGDCSAWALLGLLPLLPSSLGKYGDDITGLVSHGDELSDILSHTDDIPRLRQPDLPNWPSTPGEMDEILGIPGQQVPDLPSTPRRDKVVWNPSDNIKITYEQHPYHPDAPAYHSGPHWHIEWPGLNKHLTYLSGQPMPK